MVVTINSVVMIVKILVVFEHCRTDITFEMLRMILITKCCNVQSSKSSIATMANQIDTFEKVVLT